MSGIRGCVPLVTGIWGAAARGWDAAEQGRLLLLDVACPLLLEALKCPPTPGTTRARQQLCPAFPCLQTEAEGGSPNPHPLPPPLPPSAPQVPHPSSVLSGALLSPLGDEGGCLTSAAHSGRKSLLLLSTVQQNTASIHPWMGSYPVLSHSPTKHNTAQGALSLQEVTAPEGLGLLSPSPDSGPLPQSVRVLLAPEQRAEGQRACRRVRISLLSEDPVPPPAV